ncbi:RluA family pseudouridine synthase [Halodesulfovibrio marinisediminis]|uniref:23S rRNA pseudouridine955/2504/2580 synthase n=1 Tax=Halodesulfovibrio marinisediminis DSM 17456 TaxID=1121457 RepID=A0A1N6EW62_9BACT|nr:RluA family pseudouridine synthase [Halodesulfovibrio marinisediminis]SIN87191.1 23S rRNA pseudouridine955/2504/2580 synthase [Halodesulfovibrio marinisediminis DSM 17456]
MGSKVEFVRVTPEEAGQKLLQFLQRRVDKDVPKSAIMRWIRTGQVRVNKGRVKPFVRLKQDDMVRIPPYTIDELRASEQKKEKLDSAKEHVELIIVGEADGLLVLYKPAGLPVQPGTGHADAVTTRLKAKYADAPFCPTPAHRLDKNTSGLLLVATSYTRLQELHELFRNEHALGKHYLAWVEGRWKYPDTVELHDQLSKQTQEDGKERMETGGGKESLCTVTPLLVTNRKSLLHISLQTGRTHQIRVQLSSRNHPIIGDTKYNGLPNTQGMLLHAWRIVLPDESFICMPRWTPPFDVGAELVSNI